MRRAKLSPILLSFILKMPIGHRMLWRRSESKNDWVIQRVEADLFKLYTVDNKFGVVRCVNTKCTCFMNCLNFQSDVNFTFKTSLNLHSSVR
jgi:hypothetical protein